MATFGELIDVIETYDSHPTWMLDDYADEIDLQQWHDNLKRMMRGMVEEIEGEQ